MVLRSVLSGGFPVVVSVSAVIFVPSGLHLVQDSPQDTASALLAKYVELESAGLTEGQTQGLTENMKRAAAALTEAFQKQLGKMVENEVTDMEADVAVLEQVMRMEGLK